MKTFIALTFIGILTYAYAGLFTSECKNPTPMKGFNATKFFNGKWYETHIDKAENRIVCLSFTTSSPSDGRYVIDYNPETPNTNVHCEAKREKEKKLTFNCKRGGSAIQKEVFVVLDTDYNDYAVFYKCIIFEGNSMAAGSLKDYYLALTRKWSKEDIAGAKKLIKELKLEKCKRP